MYTQPTDMRKGIDGLSGVVREKFGADPTDGSLFVLVNRARNRMKRLHFEGKGFWLYYRVLEAGTYENLADTGSAVLRLEATQLWMLLDGVSLMASQKRRKPYTHPTGGWEHAYRRLWERFVRRKRERYSDPNQL